ncbi:MAG: NAD(P)H-binding protein [Solirubrobacteraceae bacterium]
MRVLVTGATGYVGGQLIPVLLERGHEVRALARNPDKADLPEGVEVFKGDVLSGDGLAAALDGVDVAYYLVHSMGGDGGFAERDRQGAHTFGKAARHVARVIYLGGLEGEEAPSEHLRSRHEVAKILRRHVDQLVYVRAAMVLGKGSESYVIMSKLVERLPAMIAPRWVDTKTQPVAIRDVVATLATLADFEDPPEEVQLGGSDVLTYRQMMRRYALLSGRRPRPMFGVPFFTPGLSSLWVVLVSGVDRGVAVPLVHGLSAEMLVRKPPPPGINDAPMGFDDAVREALAS